MELKSFTYAVAAKLKVGDSDFSEVRSEYPNLSTVNFGSRSFNSYEECVVSCKKLMDDLAKNANAHAKRERFKVGSEVNPILSNKETLSKDWGVGELARLWIFDEKMEKTGQIHAIAQSKIFGSTISQVQLN